MSSAWDNVADAVVAEDFYRPDHALIFSAIGALAGEAKPCDVVTVSQHLERTGRLEDAGGLAYLSSVARDTPSAANVRSYADIVRERSLLRQLIRAGTEIATAVFNNDGQSASELVDRAEQKVFEIAEGEFPQARWRGGRAHAPARGHRPDRRVAQQPGQAARACPQASLTSTSSPGACVPGDLIIVAGRPSMGKTTLAVNMAEYAAVNPGSKRLGRDLQHGDALRAGHHAHARLHRRGAAEQPAQRAHHR